VREWYLSVLTHLDADCRTFVQTLYRQTQKLIINGFTTFIITTAVREPGKAVQHRGESTEIPLHHFGMAVFRTLLGRFLGNGQISVGSARDTFDALKHIGLAEAETRNVRGAVAELR
jgi:hypothetical protein